MNKLIYVCLLCLLLPLVLSSCTVGPDYERPELNTTTEWQSSENAHALLADTQPALIDWWKLLGDPQLNELVQKAAIHNLDIRIAESAILEARALRGQSASGYYPVIAGQAGYQRQRMSTAGPVPVPPTVPVEYNYYTAGFDASWELDLFGGVGRAVEAADARLDSILETRRDTLVSVVAEVARNYAELRGGQRRMAITLKNIELQRTTLLVVKQRYKVGEASEFDVARVEAQVQAIEAALPNQLAAIRANAYNIALLCGAEPQALLDELLDYKPLPLAPEVVPLGLRSDILRRRPDIRRAERLLAAETADIGVATAELFPKFFLTGSIATQSVRFSDAFTGSSSTWGLGPGISWPIFRGGAIQARIRAEEAQAQAAALRYEKTVLNALADAESALTRYAEELETSHRFQKSAKSGRRAVRLAKERYREGEDNILAVVDAERELARTEDELVQSETRVLLNLISLYKALGGGWEEFENIPDE